MAAIPAIKLTTPIKLAIGAAVFVLIGAAYFLVVYSDVQKRIEGARKQTSDLSSEQMRQKQSEQSYFLDKDELVMRQQRQRDLNKMLPADTEIAAFLSAVQQVSNVSGVDLKAWQPQDESTKEFFAKVPMRLEMKGHFHQFAKFAYEVGKLDRIINVENIELSDPHVEGDDVVLKAVCLATTFHTLKKGGAK